MKLNLFLFLLLVLAQLNAQIVPSSCTSNDSITNLYKKDADRLALRHTFALNTTYKDSIRINKVTSKTFRDALLAVYNATALGVRDTIVNVFKIHTDLGPELNAVSVKASANETWMQQLQANSTPTSNISLMALWNKYNLGFTYSQSTLYDLVVFRTDTNVNAKAFALAFAPIQGVISATPEANFNDTKNITATINPGYTELVYSIGWGSCEDTCNLRRYWKLKVNPDCSVEYLGVSGASLFLGLKNNSTTNDLSVFPNPTTGQLKIQSTEPVNADRITIFNALGHTVLMNANPAKDAEIDLQKFENGIYFLEIRSGEERILKKIVKN